MKGMTEMTDEFNFGCKSQNCVLESLKNTLYLLRLCVTDALRF